ncbi:MAG: hypothetical protein OHK0022_11090 [Roseiflexaceae bacterium]
MNVLIIAEDPTQDYFILEPLVAAMLAELGKPRAKVRVCRDPVYRGINTVLKPESLEAIIRRYPMIDVFLLCVDRDGDENRRTQLDVREQSCAALLQQRRDVIFLAENAWQEVEVWALAGCTDLPGEWRWRDLRAERDPKEAYFEPYVAQKGLTATPGAGRMILGRQAASRYGRVRQLCPEDIGALEERLRERLGGQ